MRRALHSFILAVAWVASAAAASNDPLANLRYNEADLQAEVSREVQNDSMTATLYIEANDPNPAQLANTLNRTINEALKTASEVKGVRARSGGNQTYPVYDRSNKVSGWRGRSEIRLEGRDFQALSALIGKLQSTLQLGGVSFMVSPELRRQTENELITEGINAFKARADIVRQALGGKGLKIRKIAVNTGSGPPPRPMPQMRAQSMASSSVEAPVFEGGTSQVQVVVSGTIEVE